MKTNKCLIKIKVMTQEVLIFMILLIVLLVVAKQVSK